MGIMSSMFGSGNGAVKYKAGKFIITFKDKEALKFITLLTKRNPNITISGSKLTMKVTNDIDAEDLLGFFKSAGIIS